MTSCPLPSSQPEYLYNLARLALVSYEPNEEAVKEELRTNGFGECTVEFIEVVGKVGVMVMCSPACKLQCVVFRGTANVTNVVQDMNFPFAKDPTLDNMKFHQGFLGVTDALFNQIASKLRPVSEGYSVRVVGHSLGGAIAVIFSLKLNARTTSGGVEQVVTFGQPKVTDADGAERAKTMINLVRVAHEHDIVSKSPPGTFLSMNIGYKHFGEKIVCKGPESGKDAHACGNYVLWMQQKMDQQQS